MQIERVWAMPTSDTFDCPPMGKTRNYVIQEILLVCHGRAHNDTIITVDQKKAHQLDMPSIRSL